MSTDPRPASDRWWEAMEAVRLDEYLEDLTVVLGGYWFASRIIRREQTDDADRMANDLGVVRDRTLEDIQALTARAKGGAA